MTEARAGQVRASARSLLSRIPAIEALARLTLETIRICLRYRVTGLASEAGFFALLSLPPLVLGLFGGVGYVGRWLGAAQVQDVRVAIETYAARFLTEDVIATTLGPTIDDVFAGGRFDLISLGFLLSIWSGSRALNVFLDTISIMYGQADVRGIVATRALSLLLYVVALVIGIVTIPLVLIGPTWLGEILPDGRWQALTQLYWPVVSVVTVASLASLFHIATPQRSPWLRDVPGAVLTLVIWFIASFVLRGVVASSLKGSTSIYGPLAAPIIVLIWLYFLAIAVLIGAALNGAIRELYPSPETRGLRERAVATVRDRMVRRAEDQLDRPMTEEGLAFEAIKEAARRPLTPVGDGRTLEDELEEQDRVDALAREFGERGEDQLMSDGTRSGVRPVNDTNSARTRM